MRRKVFTCVSLIILIGISGGYIYRNQTHTKGLDLTLENIEALADCESGVESGRGREVEIKCTNSSGETYTLRACDFDSGYEGTCTGRPANDK